MATIYLDIPNYTPEYVIVEQAVTEGGTRTEVVNATYGSFPQANGELIIDSVDILTTRYSFIRFNTAGEDSQELVLEPAGSLTVSLQTVFDKVLPRLRSEPPVRDFISTVQHVVDFIDNRLFHVSSDLIMVENADDVATGANELNLPFTMLGVMEHPYISYTDCDKKELALLPEYWRGRLTTADVPVYYELRGGRMKLYPTTDRDIVVHYTTYNKTVVEELTDPIPYDGIFNDTIVELVVKFGANPAAALIDPMIEQIVNNAVDRLIHSRRPKNIRFLQMSNYV